MFSKNIKSTNLYTKVTCSKWWDFNINYILIQNRWIINDNFLSASLQEFFQCFVGSNSYLTPPNSQGFAPHYDDIEAFILQVEGKKRWRLYKPKSRNETLPRYSSANFSQEEIGDPILDTIVEPGDLLYFPRGTIHQGDTFGLNQHSLHITLSVYQKNSWGDFLEKLLPLALNNAIQNDIRFRKGLPINYSQHIGFSFAKKNHEFHEEFSDQVKHLLNILISEYLNINATADELAKYHIHDFLPPYLNKYENVCSVYGGGEKMTASKVIINRVQIKPNTRIRLSRAHCIR